MTNLNRHGGRRRRLPLTLLAVTTLLASLMGSTALADHTDSLTFRQPQFYGSTAGELAASGEVENLPGTCGEEEGEVGWHFVAPGGHFTTATFEFDDGDPTIVYPDDVGDGVTGQTTGNDADPQHLYVTTSPDDALTFAEATGKAAQDSFVLSHVCVPEDAFIEVTKFIDVDESGTITGPDIVDGPSDDLAGWEFNVHAGSDTTGTLVDTLVTDNTGSTPTIEVDPGTYTVEEVNTGKTITVDAAPTVVTTVNPQTQTLDAGDLGSFAFGNACTIEKDFAITGVAGEPDLLAWYDETSDAGISTGVTYVELTGPDGEGTYTGTAPERFRDGDTIEWGYGLDTDGDGDLTDEDAGNVVVVGDETFSWSTDGYPDCARLNQVEFDNPSIEALKIKDADDDGDPEDIGGLHVPLEDWTIQLYESDGTTLIEEIDTDAAGSVLFDELTAGETYVVCEVQQENWLQTYPDPEVDACHTLTMSLDEEAEVAFHNTPLSEIRVGFTDLTGFTNVQITCTDAEGNLVAELNTDGFTDEELEDFDNRLEDYRLRQGTLSCDFEVVDP